MSRRSEYVASKSQHLGIAARSLHPRPGSPTSLPRPSASEDYSELAPRTATRRGSRRIPASPVRPSAIKRALEGSGMIAKGAVPGVGEFSTRKSAALSPVSTFAKRRARLLPGETSGVDAPSPAKNSNGEKTPYPIASSTPVSFLRTTESGPF